MISNIHNEDRTDDFQTPDWVCDIMASMLPEDTECVLEPTAGKGNIVRAILRRFPSCNVVAPSEIFDYDPREARIDWIVGNPPYSPMLLGYNMLKMIHRWCPRIIFIVPWLLLTNSQERSTWFQENGLLEVIHLPRHVFEGSRVQMCIIKMVDHIVFNTTLFLDINKYPK